MQIFNFFFFTRICFSHFFKNFSINNPPSVTNKVKVKDCKLYVACIDSFCVLNRISENIFYIGKAKLLKTHISQKLPR